MWALSIAPKAKLGIPMRIDVVYCTITNDAGLLDCEIPLTLAYHLAT